MKLSVSLSADEVAHLDAYAHAAGLSSRSAAVQHAIRLLQLAELDDDYEAAWSEWESTGERAAWEGTIGDGLSRQVG